jgi:plasmid maintenance system antidote protein VapI
MKLKQKYISQRLGVSQTMVSLILAGKRPITWPLAEKLSDIFPGRSVREWKYAKPVEVKKAFLTKMYSEDMEQH